MNEQEALSYLIADLASTFENYGGLYFFSTVEDFQEAIRGNMAIAVHLVDPLCDGLERFVEQYKGDTISEIKEIIKKDNITNIAKLTDIFHILGKVEIVHEFSDGTIIK